MSYIKQYFRDINALMFKANTNNKLKLFFTYNRLCVINILFTKLFRIKTTKQKILGYVIHYDNFNSFFAMFSEIFLHNIYGELKVQGKNPVIVDCGANIGIATLYFKHKYPNAKIVIFEPDPGTFKILTQNCESNNLKNVTLYNKALSDTNGKIKFYSYGAFEGSPGNTVHKKWVNFKNVKEYSIDCMTLSSLNLKKIDLLKIDVEGAEGSIIKDLYETNTLKNVDKISLEYHYGTGNSSNNLSSIISKLEDSNFEYIINPDSLIEDNISVNKFMKDYVYVLIINCMKKKAKK